MEELYWRIFSNQHASFSRGFVSCESRFSIYLIIGKSDVEKYKIEWILNSMRVSLMWSRCISEDHRIELLDDD